MAGITDYRHIMDDVTSTNDEVKSVISKVEDLLKKDQIPKDKGQEIVQQLGGIISKNDSIREKIHIEQTRCRAKEVPDPIGLLDFGEWAWEREQERNNTVDGEGCAGAARGDDLPRDFN